MEILAPAGAEEQLVAAVRCGADAVYLGTKGFNARRGAANFDGEALTRAVCYCHARGVKVHVTINTLVSDSEMGELESTVKTIAASGADAAIIQDLAVARLVHECCPSLKMHASTQMSLHNLSGVKALEPLGFTRAVLARELSLAEIAYIAANTPLEIEVFVHGALCMSVSGQCYLSSMLGGRSGNRGMCAQPCRLNFCRNGKEYALSLKDMTYIDHLPELEKAGVCSLKIEGRMKRPEYVAAAVTACKTARDGGTPDMEALQAVFSRGGFTDGYLTGKRGDTMFGHRGKDDVEATSGVLKKLAMLYKDEAQRVPVDIALRACGSSVLTVTDCDGNTAVSKGDAPEKANNPAATMPEKNLLKTGGTPFYVNSCHIDAQKGFILPASSINAMRREALDVLLKTRENPAPLQFYEKNAAPHTEHTAISQPEIRVRALRALQVPDNAARVILPLSEIDRTATERFGERLTGEIPALVFDENRLTEKLRKLRDAGLSSVLCENIGAVYLARGLGFKLYGGHGLNIYNTAALAEYEAMGVSDATLSFELSAGKIRALGGAMPRGIIGYGYLPLMRMRACPAKGAGGCGKCNGNPALTDRRGTNFPMLCFEKTFTTLLNSLPLYIADKDIRGVDFMTLWFTTESQEECADIFSDFKNHAVPDKERTNGLYFRNVL